MFRIVLYGPPLAGKTTMLAAFGQRHAAVPTAFEDKEGGIAVRRGLRLELPGGELTTIAGAYFKTGWPELLASATHLLLVLDPQETRTATTAEFVKALANMPAAPEVGCVVWTKQDLLASGISTTASELLLVGTRYEKWPVFKTQKDAREALVAPLEWLIARARA